MPTNDPPPPLTISRAACLSTYMVPLMFRSTVRRHASESICVIGPMVSLPPAQCTTPCNRPDHAVAASTARVTSSSLVTSAGSYMTEPGPPRAVISSAAAESLSALRPTSIALPPAATTAAAHALPMPLPPPVTSTVCPVNDSCTADSFVRQLEQVLVIRHGSLWRASLGAPSVRQSGTSGGRPTGYRFSFAAAQCACPS